MSQMNDSIKITEIRKRLEGSQGETYWRSLEELADTPEFREFLHKEFPRQAAPLESSLNRRDFMKLLGASLALAGLTSCVRPLSPHEKILPYVRQPEEIIPGKPLFYATALRTCGYAQGVLVESHMGRPTKIEGNPDHPASLGATDATMQASILSLYDPDRAQSIYMGDAPRRWEEFGETLSAALTDAGDGAGLRLLTETVTSPTLVAQIEALLSAYPQAQWYQYDPWHTDNARDGAELAFGRNVNTIYNFAEADVILSLGADFLGTGPASVRYQREFARARRVRLPEDEMNRLYVFETTVSTTGGMADHRLPLRPSQIAAAARQVAAALGLAVETSEEVLPEGWAEVIAEDLRTSGRNSLVVAGDDQPPFVHALVHAMNELLGNVGTTVTYTEPVEPNTDTNRGNHFSGLAELVRDMRDGNVDTLVMIGGNPVYNAPVDLGFADALERVPFSVHLSDYRDETSWLATWHIPRAHDLETWGDATAFDGTVTIMQPLIAPFYGGKSAYELLAALLGDPLRSSYDIIREAWQQRVEGDFDLFWREALYRGTIEGTSVPEVDVSVQGAFLQEPAAPVADGLEFVFSPDPYVRCGEYSNNGWLQELPKPFTKLTWDNPVLLSPATAEAYELRSGDVVTLELAGRSAVAPVLVLPGMADRTLTMFLGFGRERAGNVGNGVGFNAFPLRASTAPWVGTGVSIRKTGEWYRLADAQQHHAIEARRAKYLLRSNTLEGFRKNQTFVGDVQSYFHESDLYPDYEYQTYAWGMVIDQTVCTSCSACVVACQAENNIPVVGRDQVVVSREMHWLRIDTYYKGDLDNPDFFHQPMLCQHCEKAPCEPVCPVAATVHDSEGLNVMVYNRCVGTRYCSNNCPYKVRRFNYLQYAELEENALIMMQNPDVTVRSRGVMEKCSFCVQRISEARINAETQNRRILDGEVVTACQAACPSEAIVFGNLNDHESRVAQERASILNYTLLDDLNTQPRIGYLARLRNPHPVLAPAKPADYHAAPDIHSEPETQPGAHTEEGH